MVDSFSHPSKLPKLPGRGREGGWVRVFELSLRTVLPEFAWICPNLPAVVSHDRRFVKA